MSVFLTDLYHSLIKPVHAGLQAEYGIPDTPEAACMSIAIKCQESGFGPKLIRDQGDDGIVGPATGPWQFERNGGVAEVLEEGKVAPIFNDLCRRAGVNPQRDPVWRLFVTAAGDELACAAARLLIWKDPAQPPRIDAGSTSSLAGYAYYKRRWRPGADREADWHAKSWPTAVAIMQAIVGAGTAPGGLFSQPAAPAAPDVALPLRGEPPNQGSGGMPPAGDLERRVAALEAWRAWKG